MKEAVPNGIYVTMVTPFTEDNKIDYPAVERMIQWYDEHEVDGIFGICQSSEIFFLSFEERLELISFIAKNIPKSMTLLASGHTADDIETQKREAAAFCEVDIDAYVFISNRFAKQDEDDSVFLKNAKEVVSAIPGIPLGIYECPYPYNRLLSPKVLQELLAIGDFQFLKDTSCSVDAMRAKLEAMKGTNFKLFNANSATFLESLKIGAHGFSGVMANFHPEFYQKLFQIYKTDEQHAELLQNFVGFYSVAECQVYPLNAKYYLGTLEKLGFGFDGRTKRASTFPRNRQLEIEQMWALTQMWKKGEHMQL